MTSLSNYSSDFEVDEPEKYSTYFLKIDNVKFRQKVVPGDTLIFRVELMAPIPDPDSPNNLLNHEYSKYKLNFNGYLGHRQLDPDKPAPTVTARGDNKGGVVILPHPNGKRRMSCRELAAVQSFPLSYEFYGNRSSIYRQIGNAVPPLLGYAVANVFNQYKEG